MKDDARRKYWREMRKIAYPDSSKSTGRTLTTKELFEILTKR